MITGKDLIDLGYKPNKAFKDAIEYINTNNLSGDDLKFYMDSIQPIHIQPHEKPVTFYKNIKFENEEDAENVKVVVDTMEQIMITPTIVNGCVMPDACPTGEGQIPVGGVVVAKNAIHPSMHSADICCSVMMTDFGFIDPKRVLDSIHSVTHFGGGGRSEFSELPRKLISEILDNKFLFQTQQKLWFDFKLSNEYNLDIIKTAIK